MLAVGLIGRKQVRSRTIALSCLLPTLQGQAGQAAGGSGGARGRCRAGRWRQAVSGLSSISWRDIGCFFTPHLLHRLCAAVILAQLTQLCSPKYQTLP